ncbi:MAG: hypothetical protein KJ957_01950 [Candidatus Omnitrophica bacterium]|nr:hypothetical protein [Candidatus Omnitrophota bacterium]
MENKKITVILLAIIAGLITAGYAVGFFIFMDYRQKTIYLDKQTQVAIERFEAIESSLQKLSMNLENTIDKNRLQKEDLLAEIEVIEGEMHDWKNGCGTILSEIKGQIDELEIDRLTRRVENIQDDINKFKTEIQDLDLKIDDTRRDVKFNVDLGKISVKK